MLFKQFALSLILAYLTGCNTLTPGAPPATPQPPAAPTIIETATATTTPTVPLTPANVPTVLSPSSATVRAAVLRLSHEGIADPNLVSLVRVTPTTWPDDCLGLPSGLVCHSTLTPGYLIELELGGQRYLVRTDQEGKQARLASSPVGPITDAFIQWRYIDNQECKNALIGTNQIRYGICREALLALELSGPPRKGPSIVNSSQATYLKQKYAPFTANTIRGTLVFTGTGTVKAGRAEQRAIAEWASYAWAQADLTYLSADVGLSLFWAEETSTFCGALWIYKTGFAAAWDCPGIKVINSGFLPEEELEQFYKWLDSGKQWNISRTVGADGKPAKINLDFAMTPGGMVINEDEEKVLQFARQVYARLSTSPFGILQRFMQARIDGDESGVLDLLTDRLRSQAMRGLPLNVPLTQVSNPCWYRYLVLALNQASATQAQARVRVYEHQWPGDNAGSRPRSWEQEIGLVQTSSGWRVDHLSAAENEREEPGEPHGPTLSACNSS